MVRNFLAGRVKAVVSLGLDLWRTPSGFVTLGGTIAEAVRVIVRVLGGPLCVKEIEKGAL